MGRLSGELKRPAGIGQKSCIHTSLGFAYGIVRVLTINLAATRNPVGLPKQHAGTMPPLGGVALSDNDVAAVADLGDCTPEEGLSDAPMSAIGTKRTRHSR